MRTSDTSTKYRKQFNAMIKSARRGEIDLILTKSISRFARNTVDYLLTIMSSIAQEEARNTSANVKWNVQKRFNNGIPIVNHKRFLGYAKDKKGGNLIVVPEEAEIVKTVFHMHVNGIGPKKIASHMNSIGAKTGEGASVWTMPTIASILKNEKYTGDLVQQKTLTVDYLTHRRIKNRDIAPMFHTENAHKAIIGLSGF